MDLGLSGKRAIVTGGNRGIGRCCALALAREGARVCITARDRSLLDQAVGEINEAGGEGYAVSADLTTLEACRRVVDESAEQFGGVDVLVNCAGAARAHDILDLPTELIDDALGLKSYSYLRMSQLVIPHMKRNGWGRIVNIAGSAGASPGPGQHPGEPGQHHHPQHDARPVGRGLGGRHPGQHHLPRLYQHAKGA